MPFGIPRMAFAMIHSVDFLIWIPDRSRFGDRSYRILKSGFQSPPTIYEIGCNFKIYHKLLLYTERDLFFAANSRIIVPSVDCGTVVSDVF